MKKTLAATLCSALVIPGLGQVINEDLRKGVAILGAIFILFIAGIFELYALVKVVANTAPEADMNTYGILERLKDQDLTIVWVLLSAFGLLWIYSTVDAFIVGRRIDVRERQPEDEVLPDR
jgi:hypothetical protein